jgi:hypothetical protein
VRVQTSEQHLIAKSEQMNLLQPRSIGAQLTQRFVRPSGIRGTYHFFSFETGAWKKRLLTIVHDGPVLEGAAGTAANGWPGRLPCPYYSCR